MADSRATSCGAMIKQIHDHLEKQSNNALRPKGLTMAQLGVLLALNAEADGQLALKDIEKILHVAQSTSAGIVSRLEAKGLVDCFVSADDRRFKLVKITAAGQTCCQEAEHNMDLAEAGILSGLTETERIIFQTLLKKVRDSMQ